MVEGCHATLVCPRIPNADFLPDSSRMSPYVRPCAGSSSRLISASYSSGLSVLRVLRVLSALSVPRVPQTVTLGRESAETGTRSSALRALPSVLQAPESTVGQPMAVRRQGINVEYSMEYSKCRALNGLLVSTVDDCRLLN